MRASTGWRLLASLFLLLTLSCDSTNPVAPETPTSDPSPATAGSFTVSLSSSPAELDVGSETPGTITVTVTNADGTAAPDGTSVTLNTDLGDFGTDAQGNPVTLTTKSARSGQAQASLFPGDTVGTAKVLAQAGESAAQLLVNIVEPVEPVFVIIAVQPNIGNPDGGDQVTIQGEGFQAPLRVSFASSLATVLEVTSSRTILVETPPSITPVPAGGSLLVDVAVTNALDQPNPPTTTLGGAFTYAFEAGPPFFLLEALPNVGSADGGDTVTIRGGGFQSPVRVEFGGKTASSATVLSANEISAVTPSSPSPVPAGGSLPVDVTVFNALADAFPGQATLAGGFTYAGEATPGDLLVDSITPTSGVYSGGTTVTVSGAGFESFLTVDLGNIRQSSVSVLSSTSLTFVTAGVPVTTCPGSGRLTQQGLTVMNLSDGTSATSPAIVFDYLVPVPRIDSVSSSGGSQSGGESVTIAGANFESPVRVLFVGDVGEFAASVVSDSSDSLTVTAPAVPDTFFPTAECTTGDGGTGERRLSATASLRVINIGTSCDDSLANVYTYTPDDTSCQETTPPPPPPPPPPEPPPPAVTQCSDGIDNDGDGGIDFSPVSPAVGDDQCESAEDDSEFV